MNLSSRRFLQEYVWWFNIRNTETNAARCIDSFKLSAVSSKMRSWCTQNDDGRYDYQSTSTTRVSTHALSGSWINGQSVMCDKRPTSIMQCTSQNSASVQPTFTSLHALCPCMTKLCVYHISTGLEPSSTASTTATFPTFVDRHTFRANCTVRC